MPATENHRSSGSDLIRHFNPAWFSAVMGTAVVPLAVSFMTPGVAGPVSAVFMIVSALMFVAIFIPWTIRFFAHPEAVHADLDHPVAANFFPTMPIALILLMLWPGTLAMLRARQGRLWQGLRTKPHFTCFEDEDTARGVTGRRQRGKRLWSGH